MQSIKLRFHLLFIISFMATVAVTAQSDENQWIQIADQDGVIISYAIGDCSNAQKLQLKVLNTNNISVSTDFILVAYQNEREEEELPFFLIANGNEEITIDCINSLNSPTVLDIPINDEKNFNCMVKEVVIKTQL
jgi:hypothetical protein